MRNISRSVSHKTRLFGQSHWVNTIVVLEDFFNIVDTDINTHSAKLVSDLGMCKVLARSIKAQRTPPWPSPPTTDLPSKAVADELLERYLQTVEPIYRIFHIPTLRRDYAELWASGSKPDTAFLVQLKLIFAIGAVTYDDEFSLRSSAIRWIYEAQTWLAEPLFKPRLQIHFLQTNVLFLMARDLADVGSELVWISSGELIRKAIFMGLHRDPTGLPRMTLYAAEMRRRLWNTILEIAIQSSLTSGGPPLISMDDFDTQPPSNFDDEQLTAEQPLPKSATEFTQASVARALRSTLAARLTVVKFLNDMKSANGTYSETLQLDSELRSAYKVAREALSQFKRSNEAPHELRMVDFILHRYLSALHVPFFGPSLKDTAFAYSRKVVVDISLKLWRAAIPSVSPITSGARTASSSPSFNVLERLGICTTGLYHTVLYQALMLLAVELRTTIMEEDSIDFSPSRPELLSIFDEAKAWCLKSIAAGETSVKGHLVVCVLEADVEGLMQGNDKENRAKSLIQAAEASVQRCMPILEMAAAQGQGTDVVQQLSESWDAMPQIPLYADTADPMSWILDEGNSGLQIIPASAVQRGCSLSVMAKRTWSEASDGAQALTIKCQMDEGGPPCRRCAERDLGCVLSKNLQSIIDEKTQYSEALLQDIETLHCTLRDVTRKIGLAEPPPLQISSLKQSSSPPPNDRLIHDGTNGHNSRPGATMPDTTHGPSMDNSPQISPRDEDLPAIPIHSLYALTKLRALRSPDAPLSHRSPGLDDFIERGDMRLEDAERLFRLYHDRLDAFIYCTGCKSQTLDELRRRSPILTAAILTVAALHDPQADNVYGVCSAQFRRLVEKSMFDRRLDRDYLRAMCVASYWLSDMSWMLSGYAIRRAAESNLHNSYTRAIEDQNEDAADGARLWYILNICDQHLATLYGRPAILQGDPSMQDWQSFLESPLANNEDTRLVSQVALLCILGSIRELFGPDKGQPIPRAYLHQVAQFSKQLDNWIRHWSNSIGGQHQQIGLFPRKGALLHFHFAKLHLYSHIFRGLSGDSPIPHYLLDCATEAVRVATNTLELILSDPDIAAGVVGMPSYLHCMTAFACMFLIKVAVKYGSELVDPDRVLSLTTTLVQHFRSLPTGRWHLAKLMAPGLEKMAAMLSPNKEGELRRLGVDESSMRNGINGSTELTFPNGADQAWAGPGGEMFFDYGMSFGLSPVFNFDAAMLGPGHTPSMQEFTNGVEYQMDRPNT
ncbi:Transcriptional activator of proteases prtT [Paramyrothecium foliicola]|nr:Transcriptional activator of proteases prtT [Paramyrothecium foliicola]